MEKYRLTESRLRGMIREAVKSAALQQISQNMSDVDVAGLARKLWDKGGNCGFKPSYKQPDYRLLKNGLKNKDNRNFNVTDDEKQKLQQILARESKLRGTIREAVKSALMESDDDFIPHGYMGKSNWGGTEVQISNDGDSARFRDNYGDGPGQPTDWLEIQFDEDGVAYVETPNGVERLDMYMRY